MSCSVVARYKDNGQVSGAAAVELASIAGCQQNRLAGQLADLEGLIDDLAVVVRAALMPITVKENLNGDIGIGNQGSRFRWLESVKVTQGTCNGAGLPAAFRIAIVQKVVQLLDQWAEGEEWISRPLGAACQVSLGYVLRWFRCLVLLELLERSKVVQELRIGVVCLKPLQRAPAH
jgi:hypothetical protein